MIGLPFTNQDEEIEAIHNFVEEIVRAVNIQINLNVGTYIPKSHTPFQWCSQLTEEVALDKIMSLRRMFKSKRVKVGYHSPFGSFLEGIISRGDERAGDIILRAFKEGARLDAWEEHLDRNLWKKIIAESDWNVEKEICSEKSLEDKLPWDNIDLGFSKEFFMKEYIKAKESKLTDICSTECGDNCGICRKDKKITKYEENDKIENVNNETVELPKRDPKTESVDNSEKYKRYIFQFERKDESKYLSHISVLTIIQRTFIRAGIDIEYSQGFNPKPKIEFAQPLSLGISTKGDLGIVNLLDKVDTKKLLTNLNSCLPKSMKIIRIDKIESEKYYKKSLMALYIGSLYELELIENNSFDIKDILSKIKNSIKEFDQIFSLELTDKNTIKIGIEQLPSKPGNVIKILNQILEIENALTIFRITRLEMLTKDGAGERSPYFKLLLL